MADFSIRLLGKPLEVVRLSSLSDDDKAHVLVVLHPDEPDKRKLVAVPVEDFN